MTAITKMAGGFRLRNSGARVLLNCIFCIFGGSYSYMRSPASKADTHATLMATLCITSHGLWWNIKGYIIEPSPDVMSRYNPFIRYNRNVDTSSCMARVLI